MMRLLLGVVLLACAGLLSFSGTASVSSTVLTFDDVATSPWTAVMPAGYGGLSWENFYVVDGNYPPIYNSGYRLGVVSPPKTAYNGNADPATIRSSTSFNFMEAYFAVAYSQTTEPSQVQIDGYLGNILKYSRRVSAVTTSPTLATLNYNGIDRLVFSSLVNPADRRRSQFVMDNFTYSFDSVPPPPTLSSLEPAAIPAGSQRLTLRVSGANFASGAKVRWNGTARVTTFVSDTLLTAQIFASDLATPGAASITVLNPTPGGLSNALSFTILPAPCIYSIYPPYRNFSNSGGSGSVAVMASNGCSWTARSDHSFITITSGQTGVGNGSVEYLVAPYVTPNSPRSGTITIAGLTFSVFYGGLPAPVLSSLNLDSIIAGSANFTLIASGESFTRDCVLQWNGSNLVTSLINHNQLAAVVPAANIAAPGGASITVFNADAVVGATSNGLPFTISSPGSEADTSPRPDGSNNGAVTIADWTQVGRFAAGLDGAAPGAEFQRADCAPRVGLGDGRLTIADWVQAGRYATGLDPVVASGGPIVPAASLSSATGNKPWLVERQAVQAARLLVKAKWQSGQNGVLAIELDAVGNENALGFSFSFDPQLWRFASATVGLDASEATLHINETESASGRVGLALALPAGRALAAGTRQIVTVKFESNLNERSFRAFAGRRARFSGIEFGDYPVKREAADVEANVLSAVSP